MRLLLTGADGFTGRPFRQHAEAAGYAVVSLRADLTDRGALDQEVRQVRPEAVVHLAGIAFVGHAKEEAFYAVNTVGTTNLLDALSHLDVPPKMTLLVSSANVYGNCAESPITEEQVPAPVNHYAMSKLAMEFMARSYMDRLRIVVARPFNYTGPGQNAAFVIPKLAAHFAARAPRIALGNLHVEREFNDVRMVCEAYLQLLQIGEPGETYNVCSGKPYRLEEIISRLTRLTNHRIEVSVNPAFVRTNEVHRLCGSPGKLNDLLRRHGRNPRLPTLEDTLSSMLSAASSSE